jgi:hypothetical protein
MRDPQGTYSSSTGNFWSSHGACYSYRMEIARYAPDANPGPVIFLRCRSESPSVTTSQHMGRLYSGMASTLHVQFDWLDRAGVYLADVSHWRELNNDSWALRVNQGHGRGWLTRLVHATADDALIRTRLDAPCALWLRREPQSAEQIIWSMLPARYWDHALAGHVWRVGDVFIVEEPTLSDVGRKEFHIEVAHTGYDQLPVHVLRRGKRNPRLCTGMVRIQERSFSPSSEWYRVVPARIRSKTRASADRRFITTTPSPKLLPWPLVTPSRPTSSSGA